MGDTFRPKLVTRAYFLIIFGIGLIFELFLSLIWRLSLVNNVRGERSAAVASPAERGRGGKPPELLCSILSTI